MEGGPFYRFGSHESVQSLGVGTPDLQTHSTSWNYICCLGLQYRAFVVLRLESTQTQSETQQSMQIQIFALQGYLRGMCTDAPLDA